MPDWLTHIKNSPVAHLNQHLLGEDMDKEIKTAKAKKSSRGKSKAKDKLHWDLFAWSKQKGYELLTEYKFNEFRKYKFDFAFKEFMIAIEFEGGIFEAVSGHKTVKDFQKDVDKYNLAQSEGWKIIRFTALNYKNVISELEKQILR